MPYSSWFSIPYTLADAGLTDSEMLAVLTAIASVTTAADQVLYTTGPNVFAVTGFTAFARLLLDDVDGAAMRSTLSLGTMAVQNASAVAITGGTAALTDNSANPALKVTQAGSGNVVTFEDSAGDATPVIIDATGIVVVGHTAPVAVVNSWKVQVHGISSVLASIGIHSWATAGNNAAQLQFSHSKSGTIGTLGINASADNIGWLRFWGDDGVNNIEAATIKVLIDGTPAVNDMPGRIEFLTTLAGTQNPAVVMTIKNDGKTRIGGSGNPAQALDVVGAIIASQAIIVPTFTVATVPSAATYARGHIFVSNEVGGATGAQSDATNWRRYSDRAIVA